MIALLRRFLIDNWQRKLVSVILAMVIWIVVNHSMSSQKTIHNIPVKIINIPSGKTVEGLQPSGILNKKISLTLIGNKNVLDELTGSDLEVVIDAENKADEWIATISKKNIISLNSAIDIQQSISRVSHHDFIIKLSKLSKEKIPVILMQPIGEAPKGYQYLDIWPYQTHITVVGPDELVKKLKARGLKLTFSLNDITKEDLDSQQKAGDPKKEEISFFVPDSWKKVNIPSLSETPFQIDDPVAKSLRIDFIKTELIPFGRPIPVNIFFSPKYTQTLNPDTYQLAPNEFITKTNGLHLITAPLFAKGVSRLFVETVEDMVQVVIVAQPKSEKEKLLWNVQFISPHELENRYVAKVLSESSDEVQDLKPEMREEYLRNRFRSYMNAFRLYTLQNSKLALNIELTANTITVTPSDNKL